MMGSQSLPPIERGDLIFIGATTENPSFEVIGPLLSRTRVLVLNQHALGDLEKIVARAAKHLGVILNTDAHDFLLESANGDARVLLNVLEIAAQLGGKKLTFPEKEGVLEKRRFFFLLCLFYLR